MAIIIWRMSHISCKLILNEIYLKQQKTHNKNLNQLFITPVPSTYNFNGLSPFDKNIILLSLYKSLLFVCIQQVQSSQIPYMI